MADSEINDDPFKLLVQSIVDYAIYMLDPKGFVTSWNAGAERIKRFQTDEIVGQHFSKFYTEEDRAAGMPQKVLETVKREGRFEGEGWRVRKDGSRFWAHVVVDRIQDENGKLIGFAKITRDMTDKRETQRALLEAERYRLKLKDHQLVEAERLIDGAVLPPSPKLRRRPMGRRTARGSRREGEGPVARGDRAED